MTEAERLAQRVEVVVRPCNNYGGQPAGTRLTMTRAEFEVNRRCLEEVTGPPVATPRTARVAIPAHAARTLGFPLGRRQEGPLVYEVTRLPPDGKPALLSREELEVLGRGGGARGPRVRIDVDTGPIKEAIDRAEASVREEIESIASAFGWEDEDGDPSAWIREKVPQIRGAIRRAEQDARTLIDEMRERFDGERARLAAQALAEIEKRDQEIAKLRQALTVAEGNVAREREAATRLASEVAALKAPASAQTPSPEKGKAKS